MIVVIIAGGSGTRLWPLSTHGYPKQLLKVNGDKRSLLQNTYDRVKRLTEDIYILPETRLIDYMHEQLPEVDDGHLIVEPGLRGTANCVVAGLTKVVQSHDPDEPIAFLWADHYIRDVGGFVHSFRTAAKVSKAQGQIVLVGVEPEYASTGLGYIEKSEALDASELVYNVKSFKEKPDFSVAQKYFRSGNYLWNAGYTVGSVNTFVTAMQQYAPELYENYQKLSAAKTAKAYNETYLSFESVAVDYALTERVANLLVVPASFDWLDVGSFNDMDKAVDHDEAGNYVQGRIEIEEAQNSFVQNQEDKPLVVIGLDNVVVVNTPNGILVARKDLSQKVGAVSKRLQQ